MVNNIHHTELPGMLCNCAHHHHQHTKKVLSIKIERSMRELGLISLLHRLVAKKLQNVWRNDGRISVYHQFNFTIWSFAPLSIEFPSNTSKLVITVLASFSSSHQRERKLQSDEKQKDGSLGTRLLQYHMQIFHIVICHMYHTVALYRACVTASAYEDCNLPLSVKFYTHWSC